LQLKAYINTEIELTKLIAAIFVSFVFLLCVVFSSSTILYLIGEWTAITWMGFFTIALFIFYWSLAYRMVYQGEIDPGSNYECNS